MLPRHPTFAHSLRLPALLIAALLGGAVPLPALADRRPVATASGVALGGRDAVAYFSGAGPVAGSADHALKWHGAVWFFSSGTNLAAFEMNPSAYAPRYGGYCPVSVIEGDLRPGNPEMFVIRQGRLYLAASEEARAAILNDPGLIERADAAWKALRER
ncbi:MAG: YHS domain protein [Defluviimonas sp.]|nr:YHS domain protein [Defluviimonas sp.]